MYSFILIFVCKIKKKRSSGCSGWDRLRHRQICLISCSTGLSPRGAPTYL